MFPPGGWGRYASGKGVCIHPSAATENSIHGAALQIVQQQEIGQISGRDQPPVGQAKASGRRPAGSAINRGHRRTQRNSPPHQVIQMALFADVQRIAVVGAEAEKGRAKFIDQWGQRCQIFGNRAFPDKHLHALGTAFPGPRPGLWSRDSYECRRRDKRSAHGRKASGAWPSMCWPENAASFSMHSGSLFSTPGTFMNSASPITWG